MIHAYIITTRGLKIEHVLSSKAHNRPLSRGGHIESQGNKKLCFCPSSLALDERLDGQNLLFQHCVIKIDYFIESATYGFLFTSCETLENERVSAANE